MLEARRLEARGRVQRLEVGGKTLEAGRLEARG
jgi:hypothetical protein